MKTNARIFRVMAALLLAVAGCGDDQHTPPKADTRSDSRPDLSTPALAYTAWLSAIEKKDMAAIEYVTTPLGLKSMYWPSESTPPSFLSNWHAGARDMAPPEWVFHSLDRAKCSVIVARGGEEMQVELKKTESGWKVDYCTIPG